MNKLNRWAFLLVAAAALALGACKTEEESTAPVERAAVSAPTTEDRQAWGNYLNDLVNRNMEGVRQSPYVYLVPFDGDPEFEGKYEALSDKASTDVSRGIVSGNMLVYAGLNSAKVADLVVEAFNGVRADTMRGVKVLFVGSADDVGRVQEAVAPSGANFVHVNPAN